MKIEIDDITIYAIATVFLLWIGWPIIKFIFAMLFYWAVLLVTAPFDLFYLYFIGGFVLVSVGITKLIYG